MSGKSVIVAQLWAEGCRAELYVNDIPVVRVTPDPERQLHATAAVPQLLIPGDNVVEILVEPGSTPSVARYETRDLERRSMNVWGRLARFAQGDFMTPEAGDTLARAAFTWSDDDPRRMTFPISRTASASRWNHESAALRIAAHRWRYRVCASTGHGYGAALGRWLWLPGSG